MSWDQYSKSWAVLEMRKINFRARLLYCTCMICMYFPSSMGWCQDTQYAIVTQKKTYYLDHERPGSITQQWNFLNCYDPWRTTWANKQDSHR